MRASLLAGASLIALALSVGAARATTFSYTGGFQGFTAPSAGTYDITAIGAQGGDAGANGGLGVQASGAFFLSAGEMLRIAVGGMGGGGDEGGGGGFKGNGSSSRYAGGGKGFPAGLAGGSSNVLGGGGGGGAGGGGGSFVVTTPGTPLLIAGGGGGAAIRADMGNIAPLARSALGPARAKDRPAAYRHSQGATRVPVPL